MLPLALLVPGYSSRGNELRDDLLKELRWERIEVPFLRMILIMSSTRLSAKSLNWQPGEDANVGDGMSSLLTRMSANLD